MPIDDGKKPEAEPQTLRNNGQFDDLDYPEDDVV